MESNNFVILDGAMGTSLSKLGLKVGQRGEFLNIEAPEKVIQVHRDYIEAGSQIIYTNTFGLSRRKLKGEKYTSKELIEAGVRNAQMARGEKKEVKIALALGSIGEMLEPLGSLSFEETYELYKEQVVIGASLGVDMIVIETITDLYELKAAILAAKENTELPLITSMSFEENGRSFNGCLPESFALTANSLGVDVLGVNCSLGPFEIYPIIEKISKVTNLPLLVKANAGLPNLQGDYNMDSPSFRRGMEKVAKLGVKYLGGCCGTDASYIKELSKLFANKECPSRPHVYHSAICSPVTYLPLEGFIGVGERINPTGRKDLRESLLKGDFTAIGKEAILQSEGSCQVLDVNVGFPGIPEDQMMEKAIKTIQGLVDLPLQIDSPHLSVIEAGLRVYNGKPIVNSVTGEEEKMKEFFPLIKKYGASFIGLCLDEEGIPPTAQGRCKVALKIVERALSFGIGKEDIIIDPLALTIASNEESALVALESISLIKNKLGVKTILGISNISFGLPHRDKINASFLNLALEKGLDLGIINPLSPEIIDSLQVNNLLSGKDPGAKEYIESESKKGEKKAEDIFSSKLTVDYCLAKGLEKDLLALVEELLKEKTEMQIINAYLIPALDQVGSSYEKGEIFLPQLIKAASTARVAFDRLKVSLSAQGRGSLTKGEILLATVKGDIHDIGKNIAKVILENYGYQVYDLGKDVPIEDIVEEAKKRGIRLIGLSALMTTSLTSMEETIKEIKSLDPQISVMVGGAVLTEDYAKKIGADYYVEDVRRDIEVAKEIFN